jgi:archaellum component FlaC
MGNEENTAEAEAIKKEIESLKKIYSEVQPKFISLREPDIEDDKDMYYKKK